MSLDSQALIKAAIAEAERAAPGQTDPNPRVGAVIAEAGQIVARGYHGRDGGPHAEIMALRELGRAPGPGAVMAVTLEPCSTSGRTGACTDAIIAAGLERVVIGATDPNPAHRGRGVAILEAAGITVEAGVLAGACAALNPSFNERMGSCGNENFFEGN